MGSLRYALERHTMKFIRFKCAVWWVSANRHSCTTIIMIQFRTLPSCDKFPYACLHLIPTPTLNPKAELICLSSLFWSFLEMSYKWNHMSGFLPSIIHLKLIGVVADIRGLFLFLRWMIFHYVDRPPFVYLLTSRHLNGF